MKKLISLLVVLSLVLSFGVATFAADFQFKFAATGVPGDAHIEAMQIFADKVKELSNETITINVFHSGSLYSNVETENDALRSGDLEFAYTTPQILAVNIDYFSMFTAGYFFKNYEHMTKTFNGQIAKERLYKDIEDKLGITILGVCYMGARQLNTRVGPIKTPDDLKGLLLRMPNTPQWLFLGKALGANPTPLAFNEVYTGLSTGTIDGQDNPLPTTYNAKFYEVAKYISLTSHIVDSGWLAINTKVLNSLNENQKKAVFDAAEYIIKYIDDKNINREKDLIQTLKDQGVTVTVPDIDAFKEKVQSAYLADAAMTANWDMDLYKKIQELEK